MERKIQFKIGPIAICTLFRGFGFTQLLVSNYLDYVTSTIIYYINIAAVTVIVTFTHIPCMSVIKIKSHDQLRTYLSD